MCSPASSKLATATSSDQAQFRARVCTIREAPQWLALVSRWREEDTLPCAIRCERRWRTQGHRSSTAIEAPLQ
jgi:hypothetical protein